MGNHQINLIKRGFAAWQRYGTRTFIEKTVDYLAGQVQDRFDPVPYALGVDWRVPPRPQLINSQPLDLEHPVINWVIPHVGQGGGHRTIFRFVRYLQERGFRQRIYEMPIRRRRRSNPRELHDLIRQLYGISLSEVHPDFQAMQPADITIATAWQTAYAVFQFPETRHKVYLVQDYEPYFTPVGTVSALAENTYRFGFYGITAGAWLADKLSGEFDMSCDQFQLAVDSEIYHPLPTGEHNKVFFYARPVTARRGF
ncbi:MAG TPA: hypothetical protein VNL15_06390, partial [Dehalococcoidia bacterium]|nr:hypothetical protein [Dehalococcoidia bacterium]